MLLKDKVAIITGAASPRGLGFATAKLFAENGAKVVILDLDAQASKNAADILGAPHLGVAANVANEQQVNAAIEQVLGKYGRIDILVNNAGITQPIKTMDIKRENYDAVLDVSLRGTLLMSQAVIPTMRAQKSGSIVCISSVSAQRGGG
ncbi:SDR family oxidoreductase, partial [Dickeya dadantii]